MLRINIGINPRQPLEANVGAHPKNTEEQALLQEIRGKSFTAARGQETLSPSREQGGFLEHVEQIGHAPATHDLRFQAWKMLRLGLHRKWGECDPSLPAFPTDRDILRFLCHKAFKRRECSG